MQAPLLVFTEKLNQAPSTSGPTLSDLEEAPELDVDEALRQVGWLYYLIRALGLYVHVKRFPEPTRLALQRKKWLPTVVNCAVGAFCAFWVVVALDGVFQYLQDIASDDFLEARSAFARVRVVVFFF